MNSLCFSRFHKVGILSHLKAKNRLICTFKSVSPSLASKQLFLKASTPVITQSHKFWETFPAPNFSLYVKDGLKKETNDIIYRSKMFSYVFYAQLVGLGGFAAQLGYSIFYGYKVTVLHQNVDAFQVGPFTAVYDVWGMIILGIFFVQNAMMYHCAQRALLRVYYRPKTNDYVYVTLGWNPFRSRLLHCKPGDLKNLNIENLQAMLGNHTLNGRKLFIQTNYYKSIYHYNNALGQAVRET